MTLMSPFACMSPVVSMLSMDPVTVALMEEALSTSTMTWLAPFVVGTTSTFKGVQTEMVSNALKSVVLVAAMQPKQHVATNSKTNDLERT